MAVSLVGTGAITSTINGTSLSLTFSTGAATTGDIVIAFWACTRSGLAATLTSSSSASYTEIVRVVNGNHNLGAWYRVITSSNETVVRSCATGSAQDAVGLAAYVYRNFAAGPVIAFNSTIGGSSLPDSPAVTTAAPNDAVISAIIINSVLGGLTAPSSFVNAQSTTASDTRGMSMGEAWITITSPSSFNPGPWTALESKVWASITATLKSTEVEAPFSWYPMISGYPDMINERMPMIGY